MQATTSWIIRIAAGAAASLAAQTVALAGDVSVAVNLNAPGVYGQLTLGGDVPTPELIMPRAVIAVPSREVVATPPAPLYLHVPAGYERHWARHCREYNACGRPVYFVSERWYHDVYTPRQQLRERAHEEHFRHEMRAHEEHEVRHEEHAHDDHHDHDHDHDHDHHDHDHDHR